MNAAAYALNAERGGVEIRFPERPSAAILADLKAHGWRWSKFSACWYQRDTPAARQYAAELVGGLTGTPAADVAPTAPALPRPGRGSRPRSRSTVTRFQGEDGGRGVEVYQNPRGRCEDAPCCGCCS